MLAGASHVVGSHIKISYFYAVQAKGNAYGGGLFDVLLARDSYEFSILVSYVCSECLILTARSQI